MEKNIQTKLRDTQITLSYISFISSLLIIIFFIKYTNLRSLTYYFILFISFSEIIGNIPYCLMIKELNNNDLDNNNNNNIYINMLIAFSDSFTMTSLLSYSYLISSFFKNNEQKIFKSKNYFLLLSFITSIIYLIIVKISKKENNNIRIYIYKSNNDNNFPIFHLIFNLIISILILLIVRMTVKYIKNQAKTDQKNKWKILSICHTLYNYPLIGCIGWFINFIIFILQLIKSENNNLVRLLWLLYILSTIIFHLRGTLIFYEFITSEKVLKNLNATFNNIKYKLTAGKKRKMSLN